MPQTAQQLIAQNRQQHQAGNHQAAKRLDLGMCGLIYLKTQIPELFELFWLEELVLSNDWGEWNEGSGGWEFNRSQNSGTKNKLHRLPAALAQLSQLRVFICGGKIGANWAISDISPIQALSNLQHVDLSYNQITAIANLDNLPNLQYLNLSYNQITAIANLDKLPNLQTLDLTDNQITEIANLDNLPNLQQLYLYNNQITKIDTTIDLPNLQELDLSNNQIAEIAHLDNLPNLQDLDLEGNQITEIAHLDKLPNLQKLILSRNKITEIANLDKLPNLQTLNLSNNQITEIANLDKLPNLQTLYLNWNQITEIENLDKLPNLQNLDLSENQVAKLGDTINLPNLQELYLRRNQITEIENLDKLPNLQQLYLYKNKITKIDTTIDLPNLQHLDLSSNQIREIENLDKLPNLQHLYLSENKITEIANLDNLPNLQTLDLSRNQITEIENLDKLPNLQQLNLNHNQITEIANLDKLPNLQTLELSSNQITEIANLDNLPNLQTLYLNNNQITEISNLDNLPNLQKLYLSSNQIESPIGLAFLAQFPKLEKLVLSNNPLSNIPAEVVTEHDCLPNLRSYLVDLEQGGEPNNEVKVLLIGNGGVGKTQVAGRLVYQKAFVFEAQHHSTHGISLLQRNLPCEVLPQGLQLNIWDFGGQDIYHATHRLFMRSRALFLLVWDRQSEAAETHTWQGHNYRNEPLRYWLSYAHYFGEQSPVLVVENKIDATAALPNLCTPPVQDALKKEHAAISDFVEVSAKEGTHFHDLTDAISDIFKQNEMLKADLLNKKLPKPWVAVRNRIRQEQKNPQGQKEIDVATFGAWCAEANIPQSAKTLLSFFHNTGVFYYRPPYFGGRIIIDQTWAIEAVYKVLERTSNFSKKLREKGILSYQDIRDKIWADNSDDERELFIDFMLSSELCFETTSRYARLQDRTFIVPQLLPLAEPDYIQDLQERIGAEQVESIDYRFLPSVFIQRFIIKAQRFSEHPYMWQSGIALQHGEACAIVRAWHLPGSYKITIHYNAAAAAQQSGLLKAITEELEKLTNEEGNTPKAEYKKTGFDGLELSSKPNKFNTMNKKLNVFISYALEDEAFKKALDGHAVMLRRNESKIAKWEDNQLLAGTNLSEAIEKLKNADLIIILASSDYLANDQLWKDELEQAMQRHNNKTARIVPINIRTFDARGLPFSSIQGLPRQGVVRSPSNDEAWTEIVRELNKLVDDMLTKGLGTDATHHTPPNNNTPPLPQSNIANITGDGVIFIQDVQNSHINIGGKKVVEDTPPPPPQKTILFLAANPENASRIQTDKEYRIIKAEMERGTHRDQYKFLLPQLSLTITELLRAMNDKPYIVHFSGHGTQEGIVIVTDDNKYQIIPDEALKRLFKPAKGSTEIVLFNACHSAAQAKIISELGMYVIGNNLPIADAAAISFAKGLYVGLGEGKTIEAAYNDAMTALLIENRAYAPIVEVWKDGEKLEW